MEMTVDGQIHILCCCPGPPCEEELQLIVGGKPSERKNVIYMKNGADLRGQIKVITKSSVR